MKNTLVSSYLSESSFLAPDDIVFSTWLTHAPFAFWLVETLAPRTFVELGSHFGFSYLAACQIVRKAGLPTRCHAVDTWRGDQHAGFYGNEVFESIAERNRKYAEFSTLIRSTFDEAVGRFPEKSIDLLHIDGRHYYGDVKHDFETWRPKMSDHGVVLFHDTQVRDRDFGVWRLFDELKASHASFEFLHGHGLGVLAVGETPAALQPLFAADDATTKFIREAYQSLGNNVQHAFEHDECVPATAKTEKHAAFMVRRHEDLIRWVSQQKRLRPVSALPAGLRRRNPFAVWNAGYGTLVKDYDALASSPLFDPDWYLATYPDVAEKGEDPVHHYLKYGGTYPMSPGPYFDARGYLDQNPDVKQKEINPLLHFIREGAASKRPLGFDAASLPDEGLDGKTRRKDER